MRCSGFLPSRDVAQPGRALAWGARGRQFKSARPDHSTTYEHFPLNHGAFDPLSGGIACCPNSSSSSRNASTFITYRTHIGSGFLLSLTKTQGRRTLNHIRSLASGIFTHAINTGRLESNPWRDVRILGKVAQPKPTAHYTLEEAENIISALVERVDCQLMIALSFFVGLRPSEIAGLRWEDFDTTAHPHPPCMCSFNRWHDEDA
jgi:integrase